MSQQMTLNTVSKWFTVTYRTPNEYLFSGTIMRRRYRANGQLVWWELDCGDYRWLLDRYALVNASYSSCGKNTAIARILGFTDPASGFAIGRVPSSLGDIDATGITFTQDRVSDSIGRVCDMAGAHWYIGHDKQISAFVDDDDVPEGSDWLAAHVKNYRDPNCLGVNGFMIYEAEHRAGRAFVPALRRARMLSHGFFKQPRCYAYDDQRKVGIDYLMGGNASIRREAVERDVVGRMHGHELAL